MEAPQEGVGIARPRRRRTCIADFGAAPVLNSPQDTGPLKHLREVQRR